MTVYSEFLFLENFVAGLLILALTGKLCGRTCRRLRMVLAGTMCGAYAFVLLVPMAWILAAAGKLIFSLLVVLVAFGFGSKTLYWKTVAVFYIVSFLMGGITIALMYFMKVPGLAGNGSVYLHGASWLSIGTGILATWVLGSWLAAFVRGKLQKDKVFTDIQVEIAEKNWEMRAFVDTGNFLREPISGHPAAILSPSCGQKILDEMKDSIACRTCVIPYRSVGQRGMLSGVRPDRIIVEGKPIEKIVLAISKEDFSRWKGEERYDVLLQQQVLEGGELKHA